MSGKWGDPNVPQNGWVCADIADLGHFPAMTCQMCEKEDIRYAHYMRHPKYKGCLIVGCICAGKMENGDIKGAKEREAFIKSRVGKKKKWLDRNWKVSKNGNQYIKTDGYVIIMKLNKNGLWSALIKNQLKNFEKWIDRRDRNENTIKLAAFDYLTDILKEKRFKIKEGSETNQALPKPAAPFVLPAPSPPPPKPPKQPVIFSPPSLPTPSVPSAIQAGLFNDIAEQTDTAETYEFTTEQKHIFNFVKNRSGHGIIDAVAGAGKTTTIMECAKYTEDQSDVLFCAFNKSIQNEIAKKFKKKGMNQVMVKTIHALGYQMLKDNNKSGKNINLQEQKYRIMLNNDPNLNDEISEYEEKLLRINGYLSDETDGIKGFAIKDFLYKFRERLLDMNQKIRATLTCDDITNFRDMVLHFNFFNDADTKSKSFNKELEIYFRCSRILLDAGNILAKNAKVVDFTDMLYLPYIWDLRASRCFSFLFIDECQDLSKAQLAVVLKYGKKNGRILAVGDPYQSIYGFAGADIESFSRIKKTIKAQKLPLTTCFRCPPNVVAMAREIRSDISASKHDDGIIREIAFKNVVKTAKPNDLIISRYREPVLFLVFEFINRNIQVQIHKDEVNEIIDELKRLFKQEERAYTISELPGEFEELKNKVYQRWLFIIEKESKKFAVSSEKEIYIQAQTEYLNNKLEFLHKKYLQWKIYCSTINDMLAKISEYISAADNCVKLSTIHRAKGLEAERVFILNYNELPHFSPNQKEWERTQERNLKYVAITRAMSELYLVENQKRASNGDDMKKETSLFDKFSIEM